MGVLLYSLISVLLISIISFIGVATLSIKKEKLKKILIYLISFSAGALFGDAFLHLLPEIFGKRIDILYSLLILGGILLFFILEKVVHWQHCHIPITKEHVHSFAYMNLFGDCLHNLIDGLIIAASYIISIPVGIATTIAVFFHEIPQEIGDFGVLIHGGFSNARALMLNFVISLSAVIGVFMGFMLKGAIENISLAIISIAVGGFIYIAGSDLIPELHKETELKVSLMQIISFVIGVVIMFLLLFFK